MKMPDQKKLPKIHKQFVRRDLQKLALSVPRRIPPELSLIKAQSKGKIPTLPRRKPKLAPFPGKSGVR